MNYTIKPSLDTSLLIAFHLGTVAPGSPLNGLYYDAVQLGGTTPNVLPNFWIPGATVRNATTGVVYRMSGTTASPAWSTM